MKQMSTVKNFCRLALPVFILIFASLSCKKGNNKIHVFDIANLPSLTVKYDTTVYFDSGRVVLRMTFPIMEQYDNVNNPFHEFKMGLYVDFFDSNKEPSGSISAKYAQYIKNNNLWELRDSVVVINENADMLETESLFWDQTKDLIYSDRFVRFTNEDQVIEGTGFESDSHLRKRKIRRVSATIYLNEEEAQ
jgi:LPS export ABC transporter protein LptC